MTFSYWVILITLKSPKQSCNVFFIPFYRCNIKAQILLTKPTGQLKLILSQYLNNGATTLLREEGAEAWRLPGGWDGKE